MNKVILLGNLTRDVEIKHTVGGKAYARVGLAVKRPFSKDKDAVDFFNLVAWEHTAAFIAKYFEKGARILIEGRLQSSTYEKEGEKHTSVDVIVEQAEFAGSKSKDNRPANAKGDFGGAPVEDDDTPF